MKAPAVTTSHRIEDLIVQAPERDRPDAGDVSDLVESIRTVGLLHPPVVSPSGALVAGLRRLTALVALGYEFVDCHVAHNLGTAKVLLQAEWDENACRRALTPEEAARARRRRAEVLEPGAKANQGRPGLPRSGNLPERGGSVRDAAATGLGYSGRTLDKVDYLINTADSDTLTDEIRDAATQALGEINGGFPVDPAFQQVKQEVIRKKAIDIEWTQRERDLRARMEAGETVVVNIGTDKSLIAWAERERRYTRVDRRSDWGNPFILDKPSQPADGDRDTVIAAYKDHFLPNKPSLLRRIPELRGRALGCWCAPVACHADLLAQSANEST